MRMKSLFGKQMFLFTSILLIGLILLDGALLQVFSSYYIEQREKNLLYQTQKLAEEYTKPFYTGVINLSDLKKDIQVLTDYTGVNVFLLDGDGRVFVVSSQINQEWVGQTITDEVVQSVLEGNAVSTQGHLGGMFKETALTVGYPIAVEDSVLGGIFLSVSMPAIEQGFKGVYKAGVMAVSIAVCISAVFVYYSSRRISKPLVAMNQAAKVIAGGNFDKRIEIEGEDEVAQLAASFNEMAESLDKNEQIRREFIANISHDLRSPLTSVQGFLTAVLDGTVPEEKRNYYLEIVLEETKRLSRLANNIMELSQVQAKAIEPNPEDFDVNELLRDCLTTLSPQFQYKEILPSAEFDTETLFVRADREMILRVVQNLLDNALKFTEIGGRIQVESASKAGKAYVVVRDSGRGMTEEEMRHVFDRFYKADGSRSEYTSGSGLGLAIAKEFIAAHLETLTVSSQPGEGSAFTFSLPLAAPAGKKGDGKAAAAKNDGR